MVEALEAMQPEIEEEKQNAIEQSPPEIRKLIEHPVWGNARQFYWVITIRLRTHTTVAVGGVMLCCNHDRHQFTELVHPVRISEKSQSGTGATKQGKTVAGPALHSVVLLEDSHTVTYSQPIISWNAELPAGMKNAIAEMRGKHAEAVDVLKFRASWSTGDGGESAGVGKAQISPGQSCEGNRALIQSFAKILCRPMNSLARTMRGTGRWKPSR